MGGFVLEQRTTLSGPREARPAERAVERDAVLSHARVVIED